MEDSMRITKAHGAARAARLVALGWVVTAELRESESDEPYEYVLEWRGEGQPPTGIGEVLPPRIG